MIPIKTRYSIRLYNIKDRKMNFLSDFEVKNISILIEFKKIILYLTSNHKAIKIK